MPWFSLARDNSPSFRARVYLYLFLLAAGCSRCTAGNSGFPFFGGRFLVVSEPETVVLVFSYIFWSAGLLRVIQCMRRQ